MRSASIPYSCWECGNSMNMEVEVIVDQVRIRVTGRRECAENWKDFVVFNFENLEILKGPHSLDSEFGEFAVEILIPYLEFAFYIKEE